MTRRSSLPGAAELFRLTSRQGLVDPAHGREPVVRAVPDPVDERADGTTGARPARQPARRPRTGEREPSGRQKHDEKITVYISADELLDLETARLTLRGEYGLRADRGRIVREALALVLADFDTNGEESVLVRRLRGS
jgi:hypothetical protein